VAAAPDKHAMPYFIVWPGPFLTLIWRGINVAYVKLDCGITESTIWLEDSDTIRLWIYLLAKADVAGVVTATIPAIARDNMFPIQKTEHILAKFTEPDPYSRNQENEGRRIEIQMAPSWAIFILNYDDHRHKAHTNAERQAIYRNRRRNAVVTESNENNGDVTQAEAEAEAEAAKGSPPATKQQEAPKRSGGLGRKQKNSTSPNGSVVWDFYSSAYQQRYGVLPTRNQKVNSQLAALVKRIGVDEAPNIAAFYLSHNRKLYVNSHHCTDLLLRDAEALRTEWLTGHKVTEWGARETDRLQTASDAVARVAKKLGAL